jgi:2-methylcitrate dehydratase PrpD
MITEKLASFIAETNLEDMPPEVAHITRRAVTDTIGVALAGSGHPAGKSIKSFVGRFVATPTATVVEDKVRTLAPLAALANGTMAHILDYDDVGEVGYQGHPSAVLVPAVLALGEELKSSGKELIAAYVIGAEVWARLSGIMPELHLKGWHPTCVLGTVGAAAAAAKLLKLSVEKTIITLAIACSEASGLTRNFGTMTKPLHAGHAAQNGIMAALLAKEGITASANIMEGDANFQTCFYGEKAGDASKIVENLGAPFAVISPGIGVKKYPSCFFTHRPLDAAFYMAETYDVKPDDVESIACLSSPVVSKMLIYNDPVTALQGKFSAQFAVAAALTDRKFGLAQVVDERVNAPEIKELMKKIKLSVHPDWKPGKDIYDKRPDVMTVKLRNGKEYRHEVRTARGCPENPMTDEELLAKYRECAAPAIRDKAIERFIELVWKLEELKNVDELMQAVSG